MAKEKINSIALGYSLAIISAGTMLLAGLFGMSSYGYMGGYSYMMSHMYGGFGVFGILSGIIWAGILGFVWGWLIARLYNRFA